MQALTIHMVKTRLSQRSMYQVTPLYRLAL